MSDEDVVYIKRSTAKAFHEKYGFLGGHLTETRALLDEIAPQLQPKWTVTWAEPSREWLVRVDGELIARFPANRNSEAWQYIEFRKDNP